MKATFNLPDPLYRAVKARSALEGKTIREVVIRLFEGWLENNSGETGTQREYRAPFETNDEGHILIDGEPAPLVFGSLREKAAGVKDHSMEAIRESIARRWDEPA